MRVANSEVKTERQWNQMGYVVKETAKGEKMWSNGYHQLSFVYFGEEEVDKATEKQLKKIHLAELEKSRTRYQKRKESLQTEKAKADKLMEMREKKVFSFLEDLDKAGDILTMMEFDGLEQLYTYKIRKENAVIGKSFDVPFGEEIRTGKIYSILDQLDVNDLSRQEWFPDGIKRAD